MDVRMKLTYSDPCSFSVARLAVKKAAAMTVHIQALTCRQADTHGKTTAAAAAAERQLLYMTRAAQRQMMNMTGCTFTTAAHTMQVFLYLCSCFSNFSKYCSTSLCFLLYVHSPRTAWQAKGW